eukprot:CAMPEP_0182466776 /NCGR_PEP_ID=MMETSP1319-20130603/12611_1 /TAXON_ID=172717 /ORGANISM="Bolidomonas pacifica, Strain RCC208" /LENGTH=68 /DNA_ID=CAMNT_0024666809 /DNA_START=367 /DNA_END=569 /DNA_ORIENTATION=+
MMSGDDASVHSNSSSSSDEDFQDAKTDLTDSLRPGPLAPPQVVSATQQQQQQQVGTPPQSFWSSTSSV